MCACSGASLVLSVVFLIFLWRTNVTVYLIYYEYNYNTLKHASMNLHDYLNPCLSELTKAFYLNFVIILQDGGHSCISTTCMLVFFTLTRSIHTGANAIKVQKLRVVDTCILAIIILKLFLHSSIANNLQLVRITEEPDALYNSCFSPTSY